MTRNSISSSQRKPYVAPAIDKPSEAVAPRGKPFTNPSEASPDVGAS